MIWLTFTQKTAGELKRLTRQPQSPAALACLLEQADGTHLAALSAQSVTEVRGWLLDLRLTLPCQQTVRATVLSMLPAACDDGPPAAPLPDTHPLHNW